MKRFILSGLLSMVVSILFGQLRVGTNGSLGTTSNIPLVFNVNNVKSGATGSSSNSGVSFGYEALLTMPSGGGWNTAVGNRALRNATGSYNTAFGSDALYANTSGAYNTACGINALKANTTASWNTAFGSNALLVNTTGYANTACGSSVLQNNTVGRDNSAFGSNALANNTTGGTNTASGAYSLDSNTTGEGNTAHGIGALHTNLSGSRNTAVGYWSNVSVGNLTNSTALGSEATVTASNQVRIGNSVVTSIGGYAAWSNISDRRMKKNIRKDVPGLSFINSLQPVTYNLDLDAVDELIKADSPDIGQSTSQELVDMQRKAKEAKEKQVQTGFVAQDVEKSAKNIGYDFSGVEVDEIGVYSLRYAEFVVPLVKAVQELSEQNERLNKRINELMDEIDLLKISPRSATSSNLIVDMPHAVLYQNEPNPFSERTVIKFELPDNTVNAYIYIFNMQGALVKQIPVNVGHSSIIINGSELTAGLYLYSLIVGGKEIDTKRMILTK